MPRARSVVGAGLFGLLVACKGGGGGSDPVPPPPPTALTLAAGPTFEELTVTWTPPATPVEGFAFEGRVESGPYEAVPGLLPGDAIGAYVLLDPATPELVTLGARMRAYRAGLYSAYSNEATYFRGLRAPVNLTVTLEDWERLRLAWAGHSVAASALQVERALYDDLTQTTGPYGVVASLPPQADTYLDESGLQPNRSYHYRLRHVGTYRGAPVQSGSVEAVANERPTPAPPTDLQALPSGAGAQLAWRNRSTLAQAVHVLRADGWTSDPYAPTLQASLPPTAASYRDEPLPVGLYTYRVSAGGTPSEAAPLLLPPAGLTATSLALPRGPYAAPDHLGRWWVASTSDPYAAAWPTLTLTPPAGTGLAPWTLDLPVGSLLAEPGLLLDADGHPHVVFLRALPNGTTSFPSDLVHAWHDGTAWRQEVLAQRTVASSSASVGAHFILGPDGWPWVAWRNAGFDLAPEWAERVAGTWVVAPVTTALLGPGRDFPLWLALGADGTCFRSLAQGGQAVLQSRAPGGSWTEEAVPAGDFDGEAPRPLPVTGGLLLAYHRTRFGEDLPDRVVALGRLGGVWGTPEELGAYATSSSGQPWAGASRDGEAAVLVPEPRPEGLWLHRWKAGSGWKVLRLRQSPGWDRSTAAFDVAGRLQVLCPAEPWATDPRHFILYAEP